MSNSDDDAFNAHMGTVVACGVVGIVGVGCFALVATHLASFAEVKPLLFTIVGYAVAKLRTPGQKPATCTCAHCTARLAPSNGHVANVGNKGGASSWKIKPRS